MTITVPGMRSNKLVSMDIDQLRGWAAFMDRAMIVSLIATIMAIAALGITTWLSFRYSGAVRAHEHALSIDTRAWKASPCRSSRMSPRHESGR